MKTMNQILTCRIEKNKVGTQLLIHSNEYYISSNIRLVLESKGLFPKRGFILKDSNREYWDNISEQTRGYNTYLTRAYRVVEGPRILEGKTVYGM